MLVALAAVVGVVGLVRNHEPADALALGVLLLLCAIAGRLLAVDLRAHPANFPEPEPSRGLWTTNAGTETATKRSRWASENRASRPL